jgi:glycosyltransferase involved in cell wall biosynthesis
MTTCDLSVVIPCLNEADSLEICLRKAKQSLGGLGIISEIIVADNGSTDASVKIAESCGATVVHVSEKGYGSALMGGIKEARGRYIIMGDADDSYDFLEIPVFVQKLQQGFELVQGCRLPSGGGHVLKTAMPFLHRWFGNPFFSLLARRWFDAPIHDVYCGMRGFTKELYERLNQRCTGMEFATEMILKASMQHAKIGEVSITLHPDKRTAHAPHLRTFRDGWRTLRFFLMMSPKFLFLIPGLILTAAGVIGCGLALPGVHIGRIVLDVHTLLFSCLGILCGYQLMLFAVLAQTFAVNEGLIPEGVYYKSFYRVVSLERGLIVSLIASAIGLLMLLNTIRMWQLTGWGAMDYSHTMRWVIPGAVLTVLGVQTGFSSFFVSILGLRKK